MEQRAAGDVGGAEQLADVPLAAGFAFHLFLGEVVDVGGEVPAENNHERPDVTDDVGDEVGAGHQQEHGERGFRHEERNWDRHQRGQARPHDVVLAHLAPDFLADVFHQRQNLLGLFLALGHVDQRLFVQRHAFLEEQHQRHEVDRLQQVGGLPGLQRRHAHDAVAHIQVLLQHIGPGVVHHVVRMHPAVRGAHGVPLPGVGLDLRILHPVPLGVQHIVGDLHVLQDLRQAQQDHAQRHHDQRGAPAGQRMRPGRQQEQAGVDGEPAEQRHAALDADQAQDVQPVFLAPGFQGLVIDGVHLAAELVDLFFREIHG